MKGFIRIALSPAKCMICSGWKAALPRSHTPPPAAMAALERHPMAATASTDKWILRLWSKKTPRMRIFCLPFAGGGVAPFRPWPMSLPEDVQVCPVQLPGRERRFREQPVVTIRPLVDSITDALSAWLDLPFVLFGCSMGALLSFEVARELRRRRAREPVQLCVAACRAPHLGSRDTL